MKKKVMLSIMRINIFHMILYLCVVPFVIYPKFGRTGFEFTIAVAIIISIAVQGTILLEKNKRR